ncbi:hypothetical protein BDB00DRAFT_762056 [Zychaea mexicana]|uniref:uncharacterized protein n=1 Tax=Zychaea mexicana TaxID=64656 RepID=UPI0022FE1694|nr:uncharacterized protein BDB00DRAFT_762056 [Zychaea mexicana]KAI9494414.1 hypothetical protein BDB00DRAFT_762056 [Zychaea mexicana]
MDNTNPAAQQQEQPATHTVGATDDPSNDEVSTAISWPIILAVVPTLGAFFAGSAEVWSDFVLSLLTLYYVYKWMTVPWSYFEGARARRIIHQNATSHRTTASPLSLDPKRIQLGQELRHEERVGLFWVLLSPFIVAYSLRFTRYFLTNHERYMGYFNLFIFVLAAMIKPSEYALSLLCDRTQELQTCLGPDERITDVLHSRVDRMHKEMNDFYGELITKKDVNEIATELDPAVKKLAKAAKRVERKEAKFKEWSEERFSAIDGKVNGLDQVILYRIEQDQLQSSQRTLVALMFLPVNIALWAAKGMIGWLPIQVPTLSSSALPSPTLSASIATRGEEEEDDAISLPPPPPPPQPTRAFNRAYSHRERGPALF